MVKKMDLAIYGAQSIALGTYEAIHNLYPIRKVRCFLVTEQGRNTEYLAGIPVLELAAFSNSLSMEEKGNIEVLIATPENVMPEIERGLEEQGFYCHVRMTSERWAELMSYHYACNKIYKPLSALPVGYHRADIHLYMAKFYKDKPLQGKYNIPEWITPIQAGAALCRERVAVAVDCEGENISWKNSNYSELTVLYWVWKNQVLSRTEKTENVYYGLVHYRRILNFSKDDILRLADNGVDVVLPYPMPYEPCIEAHHERYLKEADWNSVLKAVEELQPAYAEVFSRVLQQKYFYNYNILLARKEVFDEYCRWLFPILERVEELSIPKGKDRADRYIGYIGESLETLYFITNRDRLVIAHAGCEFLA